MDLAYPIQAILIYLALLFAPADAERIVFQGADYSAHILHEDSGWNLVGPEGNVQVSIDGTRLISTAGDKADSNDLSPYIGKAAGHDWEKQPKLSLPATTLEKTPSGFKLRNDRGTGGIYEYTISYVRKDRPGGPTCNVLGAVQKPGVIALLDGDTLSSVLLRAGGYSGQTTPPVARILAGKPGENLSNRGDFVLGVEGPAPNPAIHDGDTIYVAPTVLLELARDGSLAIDGQACPAAEIPDRLRDRVEAGVRSATLKAHRDTPLATVHSVGDACIKAGIPADRLKLDRATAPD